MSATPVVEADKTAKTPNGARNGVAPIPKVTPYLRILSRATLEFQTSCITIGEPSTIGTITARINPSWCASGVADRIGSPSRNCRCRMLGSIVVSSVREVCITPFGSPVVPDV